MKGMTDEMREEAIRELETIKMCEVDTIKQIQALDLAIASLRGPTRETVERMRGEWKTYYNGDYNDERIYCSECGRDLDDEYQTNFCPHCGEPKTDEAVDILWQRWKEALKDG